MKRFLTLLSLPFFLCALSRAIIYFSYPTSFEELSAGKAFLSFLIGFRFDISVVITFFGLPAYMMSVGRKPYKWIKTWDIAWFVLYVILLFCSTFILIADIIYFNFVKRHITTELKEALYAYDDMKELIMKSYSVYLFLLIAVILLILFFSPRIIKKLPHKRMRVYWFPLVLVVSILAARGTLETRPISVVTAYTIFGFESGTLQLNGLFSGYRSSNNSVGLNHSFFPLKKALAITTGNDFQKGVPPYPLVKYQEGLDKDGKKYNLVIIIVESLSYRYVSGLSPVKVDTTPYLHKLLSKSVVFDHFYANGPRSIFGVQAVLSGLPPIPGQPLVGTGLTSHFAGVGTLAARNGYSTIFIQSSKRDSFRLDKVAAESGFHEQYGMEDIPILLPYKDTHVFGWDYEVLMKSLDLINTHKKPVALALFTGTTHYPYPHLPKSIPIHQYPYSMGSLHGFYNTLLYMDWSIHAFLEKAKKQPWFDHTVFMITADHTNPRFDRGTFPENFHTPLIIYAPKLLKPRVISEVASEIDIAPTVAALLKLKGNYTHFGRNVLEPGKPFNGALVTLGNLSGWIGQKDYMLHTLNKRLVKGTFTKEVYTPEQWNTVENRLLANHQVVYQLIKKNQWYTNKVAK